MLLPLCLGRRLGLPVETSPSATALLPRPQGLGAVPGSGHVSHPKVQCLGPHGLLVVRAEVLKVGSPDLAALALPGNLLRMQILRSYLDLSNQKHCGRGLATYSLMSPPGNYDAF